MNRHLDPAKSYSPDAVGLNEAHEDRFFVGEYAREAFKRGMDLENEVPAVGNTVLDRLRRSKTFPCRRRVWWERPQRTLGA